MDGAAAAQGARDAHVRLVHALDDAGFDDAIAHRPSALPDWTIGHVLTHLARNADSHTRMIEGVKNGVPVAQYPGGLAQRESEINAGASRSARELVDDMRRADDAIVDAYAGVSDEIWQGNALRFATLWPVLDLPFLRWREVAIHAVDLGLPGIGTEIWSAQYVDHELRRQIGALAARLPASVAVRLAPADANWSTIVIGPRGDGSGDFVTIDCPTADLLAWTVGRTPGEPHWPALTPWVGLP